jgi:hypothetical protein
MSRNSGGGRVRLIGNTYKACAKPQLHRVASAEVRWKGFSDFNVCVPPQYLSKTQTDAQDISPRVVQIISGIQKTVSLSRRLCMVRAEMTLRASGLSEKSVKACKRVLSIRFPAHSLIPALITRIYPTDIALHYQNSP